METPSSIRRYTRSQVKDSSFTVNNKIPISRKNDESYAKADRSALIDITNDSPIVGLASGSLAGTPSSLLKKRNHHPKPTPGSGEALLRGQVNILLQKVEEEAEPHPHHHHQQQKPSGLAPTPTNTPQVPNLSDINGLHCLVVNEESQEALVFDESPFESDKCDVTRSLMFDFIDKSETLEDFSSCSSVLTEGSVFVGKSAEDDDASVWSIQVNASVPDEDEQEEFQGEEEDYYDEDGDEVEEAGLVDELCEGLSKIFVQKKTLPEFEGKHTRFLYNSDGELEGEEVTDDDSSSPANNNGILRLNGLPTPQGKHLRFPEEED